MQDLKKNKKRINGKPVNPSLQNEGLNRGYKQKPNNCGVEQPNNCGMNHEKPNHSMPPCPPPMPPCEPCGQQEQNCVKNPCAGNQCCNGLSPATFSTANSIPVAIEANRIYDTFAFQTFSNATAPNGGALSFDIEVLEVNGNVPQGGQYNVTIDKVCMSYDEIDITSLAPTVDDYTVTPCNDCNSVCDAVEEYVICVNKNIQCCRQGKGQSVVYKQRGLMARVYGLVLELKGRCGCTTFVANAYPAVLQPNGELSRVDYIQFGYNTLSTSCCLPSSQKQITLRQSYQTNLTVDCIGKGLLSMQQVNNCCDCCECYYCLNIPGGIDVILCLQEVVSLLVNEQLVVLASPAGIQPRVVDSFSNVCDFTQCSDNATQTANAQSGNTNGNSGCGCNL